MGSVLSLGEVRSLSHEHFYIMSVGCSEND